jgi:hypothetical protein
MTMASGIASLGIILCTAGLHPDLSYSMPDPTQHQPGNLTFSAVRLLNALAGRHVSQYQIAGQTASGFCSVSMK